MPTVLGFKLRPLTLGHQMLLLSQRFPLLDEDTPLTLKDLFAAVYLCSVPWRQARASLGAWWLPAYFAFWEWRTRGMDRPMELLLFREWFESQIRNADFRMSTSGAQGGQGARACGAPAPYVRLLFLVTVLRMAPEEAMDLPVITASALYAAWLDWDGRAQLVTAADRDFWAAAAAEDARRFNLDGSRKEMA